MNPRLAALRAKRDGLQEQMDAIDTQVATRSDLAMTDDERTEYETLGSAMGDITRSIDELSQQVEQQAATAAVLARIDTTSPKTPLAVVRSEPAPAMSPGEYVFHYFRSVIGDNPSEREEAATLLRAVADQATTDNTGVIPTPIVGDLIKFVDASRPVVNSMRELPMPARGKTFTRPRVTQATQVAAQSAEHAELASRKMLITGDTVTKATFGGVVDISEQDIDWTEPAMLQIVFEDLAEQYAIETEEAAATAVEAAVTTNNTDTAVAATSAALHTALGVAAGSLYGTAKALPDVLYAAVDRWAYLVGLTDTTGRPVFPSLNPSNASGTLEIASFSGNPLGVRLVVSPAFTAGFLALGATRRLERYEQNKGLAQAFEPSLLSQRVAYRGYFATKVYAQALWGLVDTA